MRRQVADHKHAARGLREVDRDRDRGASRATGVVRVTRIGGAVPVQLLDLVAEAHDGALWAIQAKAYAPTTTVTAIT